MNPIAHLFKPRICIRCYIEFKPKVGNQVNCENCSKENIRAIKRKYALKNVEKIKKKNKEYYYSNLAKVREQKRRWNNAHPERMKGYIRPPLTNKQRKDISNRTQAKRIAKRAGMIKECIVIDPEHKGIIELHHKDKNTANNSLENLEYRCHKHHAFIHRKPLS